MEVTQIQTQAGGEVAYKETANISAKNYKVIQRMWVTSNGLIIREWTVDEYVNCNPNISQIMPFLPDKYSSPIDVKAHCIEMREYYAHKNGKVVVSFTKLFDYSKDN